MKAGVSQPFLKVVAPFLVPYCAAKIRHQTTLHDGMLRASARSDKPKRRGLRFANRFDAAADHAHDDRSSNH